jgi:hypothetical protein
MKATQRLDHCNPVCRKCGNPFPPRQPGHCGSTGYVTMSDGWRICYPCADKNEREFLKDRSQPFVAYLNSDCSRVTTWTGGELMRVESKSSRRNPRGIYSSEIVSIRAIDCHGGRWHGRGGGGGLCINLFPSKS